MFGNIEEIKEELSEFIGSLKDSSAMLHSNPRFLHHQTNFDMKFWGMKDNIDMFYALEDLETGNEYKWHEKTHVKVVIEFDDMFATIIVNQVKWDEEGMVRLKKYIDENGLELVTPKKKDLEDDEAAQQLSGVGSGNGQNYFIINGLVLFDIDGVKNFLMELDHQLNEYDFEG